MHIIDKATSIIPEGKTAILLKMGGDELVLNADGTGKSGNWKFQPERRRPVSTVLIFLERPGHRDREVYIATYAGVEKPSSSSKYETPGRFVIRLTDIKLAGISRQMWKTFADAGTNPVRFLSRATK